MMNEQNENPINGQSESDDIDLGHDQQGVTEEAQRVADSIVQALDRTDSEGGKWKQRFEKKWGCQILVQCKQHPLKVALVVLPVDKHPKERNWRFKFVVDLPEAQNAAGVWPAIEARARRLEELGRFHKYIRWFFKAFSVKEWGHKRQVVSWLLYDGPLVDATGFHLYGEPPECFDRHPEEPRWSGESPNVECLHIDRPLETVLAEWISYMEKQITNPTQLLRNDLSKVNFTVDKVEDFDSHLCAGFWGLEVDGVSFKGEWVYWKIDGKTKVFLYCYHYFYMHQLSPNLRPVTDHWRWKVDILLELTDQDFNVGPGMLSIYEEMGAPPVFTPSAGALDDPTLAGLDFNTNV
jgi:hypothetical protein